MDKDETVRSADKYVVISWKGNSMESDPVDSTMESDPIDSFCLIRHFSLVCLLAVLIFFPKVSFATTVQGTTAYSSLAEAQTQINTLITVVIAAHPGATQNGNAVQWEEGSYDVNRTVTRTWTIRVGSRAITLYQICYFSNDPYGYFVSFVPTFVINVESSISFADARNKGIAQMPATQTSNATSGYYLGATRTNPVATPGEFEIHSVQYTQTSNGYTGPVSVGFTQQAVTFIPHYIDYQDTGSQLCPVPGLTPLTDPVAIDFENGARWRPDRLTADYQTKLACVQNGIVARGGTSVGTSAYRPTQYQQHLFEIVDRDFRLSRPGYMGSHPECQTLRDKVTGEMGPSPGHALRRNQPVATPGTSRHESGMAFDVTPSDLTDAQLAPVYTGCGVTHTAVPGEPWHVQ